MIAGINGSKTLTKHISCKCKCKTDAKKCNSNQKCNSDKYWCECKNLKEHHVGVKCYILNPSTRTYDNTKCLESNIGELVLLCNEIIETTKSNSPKTVPRNFIKEKGEL